jgi:hypothetical protein
MIDRTKIWNLHEHSFGLHHTVTVATKTAKENSYLQQWLAELIDECCGALPAMSQR